MEAGDPFRGSQPHSEASGPAGSLSSTHHPRHWPLLSEP